MVPPVDDYCKVTDQGVLHLFLACDYGKPCACGRKMLAVSVENEQFTLRDVRQQPTAGLVRRLAVKSR
jgi:hypothetical protein